MAVSQPDSICIKAATEPRIPETVPVAANTAAPPSRRAIPCSSASSRAIAPARSRSASCSSSLVVCNSFSALASALDASSCSLSSPSSPASIPATCVSRAVNSRVACSARSRASLKRSSKRAISALRASNLDCAAPTCPAIRARPSRRSATARVAACNLASSAANAASAAVRSLIAPLRAKRSEST